MSKKPIKKKINRKEVDPIDRLRDYVDRKIEKARDDMMDNNVQFEKLYEICNKRLNKLEEKSESVTKEKIKNKFPDEFVQQILKAEEAEIDKKEKVFCKDCAYRIRKFDDKADECLVTVYGKDTDVVTGKTSINYSACSYVNQNSDCEKFKQRNETFWERRKDGIYDRGFAGIFAPIMIGLVITAVIVVAYIKTRDQKLDYKNKTPVENLRPVGE